MQTEDCNMSKCILFGLCLVFSIIYYASCVNVILATDQPATETDVRAFIVASNVTRHVNVKALAYNSSNTIGEFSVKYDSLLVELLSSGPFDLIIQYEVNQSFFKYEYICKNTDHCLALNRKLSPYKILRIFVETTPETFNVHGRYFLK